jgi:hypothetical protein
MVVLEQTVCVGRWSLRNEVGWEAPDIDICPLVCWLNSLQVIVLIAMYKYIAVLCV